MPTFPRGHANFHLNVKNAKLIARLARECNGNVAEERRRWANVGSPVDLRGIPCIGKGIPGGAIRGTAPLPTLLAREASRDAQNAS